MIRAPLGNWLEAQATAKRQPGARYPGSMGCGPSQFSGKELDVVASVSSGRKIRFATESHKATEWGAVLLKLRYDRRRKQLGVDVKRATGLKNKDLIGVSDPFVQM